MTRRTIYGDSGAWVSEIFEGYGVQVAFERDSRKVHYIYDANEDMGFDFSLFCEIGQPFKPSFRKLLKEHGLIIELLDDGKQYFERLVYVATYPGELQGYTPPTTDHEARSLSDL